MITATAGAGVNTITSIITAAAYKYGVAPWVALDVAQVESGLNPSAVGDNGTSFGLFQLHYGGQAGNMSVGQLENPYINADVGVKNMAAAYKKGAAAGLTGFALADYTATDSGHPGYAGPGNYAAYEQQLRSAYYSYNPTTSGSDPSQVSIPSQSTGTGAQSAGIPSGNDPISVIDSALQLKNFNILHPAQSMTQDAGAIGLRAVLVIIGLVVIIFGVAKLSRI